MKHSLLWLIGVLAVLTACQKTPTFHVSGSLSGAEGKMLYFEHTALMETAILDSCLLKESGEFAFSASRPSWPDFYRLRVENKSLILAIDSTETITITAQLNTFPFTTDIEGSENSKTIAKLRKISQEVDLDSLRQYAQSVIISNPRSLAAYYALFLKKDGQYIWNILQKQDRRLYQAVTTSFQVWMKDYERTKALYSQVSEVLEWDRQVRNAQVMQQFIDQSESAFLDISLMDEDDMPRSLHTLLGDVILLDFSLTQMEHAQSYIFTLRDLYNKYQSQGFEIYSVSVDPNKLAWQDAVAALPWTTVWAEGGVQDKALRDYNVQELPTLFLIDRKGNVQGRFTNFQDLDAAIRQYL